jgi:hypothetical protein
MCGTLHSMLSYEAPQRKLAGDAVSMKACTMQSYNS